MSSTVVNLAYSSPNARLRLIADFLPRLTTDQRRWFFVDMPAGLEVVLLHARTDLSARSDLAAWLGSARTAMLVEATNFANTPSSLDSRLFFGRAPPAFYISALTICSARAAIILSGGDASGESVAAEVATLYASLLPRLVDRQRALQHYATWLEPLAGPGPELRRAVGWPVDRDHPALARLRVPMRRQTARMARRVSASLGQDYEHTRSMIGDALVARLAHTQVVRLESPYRTADPRWEAGLARTLLRAAPETNDDR